MNEVNYGIEACSEKSLETIKKRITPKLANNAGKNVLNLDWYHVVLLLLIF